MENRKPGQNPHCLILPFPLQGHINPMLRFSKRLKHKGVTRITVAITKFFLKKAQHFPATDFLVETISDGFDDGGAEKVDPDEYYSRCWETGSGSLGQLLERLRGSGSGVDCLIYDPFYPWALDVARKFGLKAAMFFTQSNTVNNIYLQAYKGELRLPLSDPEIRIPGGLPVLKPGDMPSFIRDYESDMRRSKMMINQFRKVELVDWIFVNTVYELEKEVSDWMAKSLPMRTIGPTIPSCYLDNRVPNDKSYGLSSFKPVTEPCNAWLNKQPERSVIYVSFGSFAQPKPDQMRELALALKKIEMNFLWVVRESEEPKLPENYKVETPEEKGLIVTWCRQLDVLAHEAVGCFITHCGWNSTLEALSQGVPMVGLPQWSDQSTNAKLIGDVWRMGVKGESDECGVVRRDEIVRCVERVMRGESGEEMRRRSMEWRDLAREAMGEGGSSDRNIEEFVFGLSRE